MERNDFIEKILGGVFALISIGTACSYQYNVYCVLGFSKFRKVII